MTRANDVPVPEGGDDQTDDQTDDQSINQPSDDAPFHHAKYLANKAVYCRLVPERMRHDDRMKVLHKEWAVRVTELAEHGWPAVATEKRLSQVSRCSRRLPIQWVKKNRKADAEFPLFSCRQAYVCPFCYAKQVMYSQAHLWRGMLRAANRATAADPSLPPVSFLRSTRSQTISLSEIPGRLVGAHILLKGGSRLRHKRMAESLGQQLVGSTAYCSLSPTDEPDRWSFRYAVHALVRGDNIAAPPPADSSSTAGGIRSPTLRGICDVLAEDIGYPVGNMRYDPKGVVASLRLPKDVRAPLTQRFGACRKSNKTRSGRGKGADDDR